MAGKASQGKTPKLVVFDLDMCVWEPEMYTLNKIPTPADAVRGDSGEGEQVIGCKSGRSTITLFDGALHALRQIHKGVHPEMRCAAASSADTPQAVAIGRAALGILEVVPGVTVREVLATGWPDGFEGNVQIGRTPPLSSDKSATHFPLLLEKTGIPYAEMLFFDDCNWGDHCAKVEARCPGVVGQRTPNGMTVDEWERGLSKFAERNA